MFSDSNGMPNSSSSDNSQSKETIRSPGDILRWLASLASEEVTEDTLKALSDKGKAAIDGRAESWSQLTQIKAGFCNGDAHFYNRFCAMFPEFVSVPVFRGISSIPQTFSCVDDDLIDGDKFRDFLEYWFDDDFVTGLSEGELGEFKQALTQFYKACGKDSYKACAAFSVLIEGMDGYRNNPNKYGQSSQASSSSAPRF